jgi:hypothetical protein
METRELVSAASAIAGHLAARVFETGNIAPGKIQEIARTSVQIAREIEKEIRATPRG